MENNYNTTENRDSFKVGNSSRNSQVYIGAFIIIAGLLLLFRRMGVPIPYWLTSWEMLLIGIGIIMGLKSGFRDLSWIIPIIIGAIFISNDIFPGFSFGRMIWPIGISAIGVIILTKGSRGRLKDDFSFSGTGNQPPKDNYVSGFKRIDEPDSGGTTQSTATGSSPNPPVAGFSTTNDEIECTAIFGGVKRTVVSKNFKGGEVVAVFGGAEIDLTHADIQGVVKLEATNILGGTKLIVPPTWDVQSEMVAIFGGVEDKRRIQPDLINRNKRLVLMGTAFLGGLEIKSF
jgi:hypothetical protein